VQKLHAEAPPGCLLHLGNEPGRGSLTLLDAWTVSALDECERLGRKATIFSFATGEPEPGEWALLRRSVLRAKMGGHWLNLHEYFDGHVERSVEWHIGRFKNALAAFGADTPPIVIGELGCAVTYNPYAGWQSYLTAEQYAVELAKAQAVYAPFGIPACVFLWGPWDRTTTFDIRGERVIQDAIVRINSTMPTPSPVLPKPGTAQVQARLVGLPATYTFRYVRERPDITSAQSGLIQLEEPVVYYPDDTRNGWYYVQSRQRQEQRGWMYADGVTMQPEAQAGSVTLTRAEYDQIQSILTNAAKR
jgi:hypothetical protein